jgi:hypothetical protein
MLRRCRIVRYGSSHRQIISSNHFSGCCFGRVGRLKIAQVQVEVEKEPISWVLNLGVHSMSIIFHSPLLLEPNISKSQDVHLFILAHDW